jgi:hypothetical protein
MKRKTTNIEFINDLMQYSDYGALAQCFVIDALIKMSRAVAASEAWEYPTNCPVHAESWIGVAKEINEKLNERLA